MGALFMLCDSKFNSDYPLWPRTMVGDERPDKLYFAALGHLGPHNQFLSFRGPQRSHPGGPLRGALTGVVIYRSRNVLVPWVCSPTAKNYSLKQNSGVMKDVTQIQVMSELV